MMRPGRRPDPLRRGAALVVTLLVAGALMLAGCGGDKHDSKPTPTPASSTAATPKAVTTHTRIAHVVGKLPQAARKRVAGRVGAAVDAWFRAAYIGGAYPRGAATFNKAFPGFTPNAAATARTRLGIMSNAGIAARIDRVVPVTELVALDVVAAKGKAVGVTARVKLVFRTSGKLTTRQAVLGQLDLTPATGKWQVFAFDVTKKQSTYKAKGKG